MIESLGFTVAEAENGEDALGKCRQTMPDFVLLDLRMPVMNGMEFIKHFRALPNGGVTKVIVCTIETDKNHIEQAMESGANEYIMKPFNDEIIKDKMLQVGLL